MNNMKIGFTIFRINDSSCCKKKKKEKRLRPNTVLYFRFNMAQITIKSAPPSH